MKFTKEDLAALIKEQIGTVTTSTEFGDHVKTVLGKMVEDLKSEIVRPMPQNDVKGLLTSLPFARVDGDYLTTDKGSIINLKNKSNPWVKLSQDVQDWAGEFVKYLKNGQVSKLLSGSEDTAGGYLVPEDFRAVLIMYDAEETLVWQRATVWPMSGNKIAFPKLMQNPDVNDAGFDNFAGVSLSWTEEGGEKGETEPNFGLVELIVHELAAYSEVTNSLLDDSAINLMNYLTRIFRAAWYWTTDKSFISGTGGKQPLGILTDPGVISVSRETASTIKVSDILKMDEALPAMFDPGAVWFYTKKGRSALRGQTVSGSSAELVLQESFKDISEGYSGLLLGRPAYLADGKISALGTTGDLILANWRYYYIGFRQDFSLDASTHYKFRNNRTAIRCSGRVDAQAAMAQAFVVLSSATR
jgi:HK97 family phage major capsid protein